MGKRAFNAETQKYVKELIHRMKNVMLSSYACHNIYYDLDNDDKCLNLAWLAYRANYGIRTTGKSAEVIRKALKNSLQRTRWYAFYLVHDRQYCKAVYDKQRAYIETKEREKREKKYKKMGNIRKTQEQRFFKLQQKKVIDNSESEW